MKIIRRKRTITIETCAFRQWQTQGTEESFSCPNCGKVFEQDQQLKAAESPLAGLIARTIAEGEMDPPATDPEDTNRPCGGSCAEE